MRYCWYPKKAFFSLDAKTAGTTNGKLNKDNELLITGISGRFPKSDSMEEFKQNLFKNVDMVSKQSRFKSQNITPYFGFVNNLDLFDAEFFGIVPKLAHCLDPHQRKLLEVTFEAILDAGGFFTSHNNCGYSRSSKACTSQVGKLVGTNIVGNYFRRQLNL